MVFDGLHRTRCRDLNSRPIHDERPFVIYWMQQAQRIAYNHALALGIHLANQSGRPLAVVFGLTPDYPEANRRHFRFMLDGLREIEGTLAERGIPFCVRIGSPSQVALESARHATLLVCDKGYLRHQRAWRRQVARQAPCRVIEVDSDAVVPVQVASTKCEYAARTLRPKIHRYLETYRVPLGLPPVMHKSDRHPLPGIAPSELKTFCQGIPPIPGPDQAPDHFSGGPGAAQARLRQFVDHKLATYDAQRNHPDREATANLSPYLHFGHISALEVALAVDGSRAPQAAKAAFLEELLVRRELAINYVYYTPRYNTYAGLPAWARQTLADHRADPRAPCYSAATLEAAKTHDPYWNAAMQEMKRTGFMHSYMRMYWGKKILQWRPDPAGAFKTILRLNNKYFLDGRDANSYAGVAWIFGLHDRPWKKRPIFGKVRYMAAKGLERKFNIQGYVDRIRKTMALSDG